MSVVINGISYPDASVSVIINTNEVPVPNPDPIPDPTPTPTPAPVPTSPNPFPGWPVIPSPSAQDMTGYGSGALDVTNPQTYKFSTPANIICWHRIRFVSTKFLGKRVVITHNQHTDNAHPRDVWISAVPGGPTINLQAMHVGAYLAAKFIAVFDGSATFFSGTMNLPLDTDLCLNVKAHDAGVPVDYLISVSAQS